MLALCSSINRWKNPAVSQNYAIVSLYNKSKEDTEGSWVDRDRTMGVGSKSQEPCEVELLRPCSWRKKKGMHTGDKSFKIYEFC